MLTQEYENGKTDMPVGRGENQLLFFFVAGWTGLFFKILRRWAQEGVSRMICASETGGTWMHPVWNGIWIIWSSLDKLHSYAQYF